MTAPPPRTSDAEPPNWWQNIWVRAGAMAVALLLALLVTLVGIANARRDTALSQQRHSYEVLLAIRDFDVAMARAEAALGRFAISGAPTAGRAYFDHWALAGARLDTLTGLTAPDPVQRPVIAALRVLYERRRAELDAPARSAGTRQGWAALTAFDRAGRSPSIDQLSTLVDRVSRHERATLTGLSAQAERSGAQSDILATLLSLLGVVLSIVGVVLGTLAVRAVHARREAGRRADVAADRAGALELAVEARTRELRDANVRLQVEATTRAAAEAQLHQAQKMEAVGQLTGGIAHDFNNMLAVVLGGLELAQRRLTNSPKDVARHLDQALDGATRAAALTRRLLAFARAEPLRPEHVDAARLIRGMRDLLDRALGERIVVALTIADDCWATWCDPHQLENAILNLAVNARDALDGEGRVDIITTNCTVAADEVGKLAPGDYLRIEVRDTGCGMDPAVIARAFEPFFTTKPIGKGTGLGLSQIFGFARQSGGDILISSQPGAGTGVSLYLPRHIAEVAGPTISAPSPATRNGHGETVMVVEDDPRVRTSTVEALAELGYRPIACACGEDALAALRTERDVRLVISDVVMPGMTGPDLVAAIRADHPHVATIFVTGYVGDADTGDRLRGQDVLRKPFTIAGLARAVRTSLTPVEPAVP
ncbi:ATP-binding protein [Sphingomonas prati]|uniref:histidine kinase n=1 Tax=Sphingomonas prati TaxID=1843237 RepID=A0A7W9BTH4_9SPHN|nr:ATP-binding protein [Sphingomonas prati]MBB5729308.1 signal transduction histidine kinase/ActR/RegA family two-component response regulator [Sphingomonas prati]GGE78465.1 histidine kinase [Sphingomonas prati]